MGALQLLIFLSAAIFAGETMIMFALDHLPIESQIVRNTLDGAALVVILFPLLYVFVVRALMRRNAELATAHVHLEAGQARLEERIAERTAEIAATNATLADSVSQMKLRHRQMVQLGEMSSFFQSCRDLDEAVAVAQVQLQRLFPEFAGALFLINASHNLLERTAAWGVCVDMEPYHLPKDCWALRRGKPHEVGVGTAMHCHHAHAADESWQLCLPLMAQGEALGTLHLQAAQAPRAEEPSGDRLDFFVAAAETLALAISNLRLRETLRHQARRDPLTGLFNRRYLLDTLDRELEAAAARGQDLSIVFIDIDHFKRFNDSFGHAAGDLVLGRFGGLLREWARPGDVVARYGGEEFTVILPNTSTAQARDLGEALRAAVEAMEVAHLGQSLAGITLSAGIATYPTHGIDRDALIHLADQALYAAKQAGRNRVTAAPDTAGLTRLIENGSAAA